MSDKQDLVVYIYICEIDRKIGTLAIISSNYVIRKIFLKLTILYIMYLRKI